MFYEILQADDGKYYWRLRPSKGPVVAVAFKGYKSRKGAAGAARRVWSLQQSFFFQVAHV